MSEADRMEQASQYVTEEVYAARFRRAEPLYTKQCIDQGFSYRGIPRRTKYANTDEALTALRSLFNGS